MGIALSPRHVRFPAMGTVVSVLVAGEVPVGTVGAVRDLFAEWEAALSRFLPDSELSRVNRAAGSPTPVGSLLCTVVAAALDAAQATRGVFDPTLGRHMDAVGYDRPFRGPLRLVGGTIVADLPVAGWRAVDLDVASATITIPSGTALDLGGIAKGMAVDAAAALLADAGVGVGLVDAGGDMRVAADGGADWTIGIEAAPGHSVSLSGGAIATSATTKRQWVQNGIRRHHLIDPRTGMPARSGLRSVTVAASTCARAEVAAKVALVLGPQDGSAFLGRLGLKGLMTLSDGSVRGVCGWPLGEVAA